VARLFILVEGETEETFVNEVLAPRLYAKGFEAVSAKLMGNARLRSRRGGVRPWPQVKDDILRHLKNDKRVFLTMMVDYYGMPSDAKKDDCWPGRAKARKLAFAKKADCVQQALFEEIEQELDDARRFIPFVIMHEFESLLFSDCKLFAESVGQAELEEPLQDIRDGFKSPEEINDSPATHPSQRVLNLFPGYRKPLYGNIAALEIGFESICAACPHFNSWVERLVKLGSKK
jgi:hypothetical protein